MVPLRNQKPNFDPSKSSISQGIIYFWPISENSMFLKVEYGTLIPHPYILFFIYSVWGIISMTDTETDFLAEWIRSKIAVKSNSLPLGLKGSGELWDRSVLSKIEISKNCYRQKYFRHNVRVDFHGFPRIILGSKWDRPRWGYLWVRLKARGLKCLGIFPNLPPPFSNKRRKFCIGLPLHRSNFERQVLALSPEIEKKLSRLEKILLKMLVKLH